MDKNLLNLPAGFISFDEHGKLNEVNTFFISLSGYEEHELSNASLGTLLTISTRLFFNTHILPRLMLDGKVDEIFISLLHRNGDHIPVVANFVYHSDVEAPYINGVLIPVHQNKKYEDDLRQLKNAAEKALRDNTALNEINHQLKSQSEMFDRQLTLRDIEAENRTQFNKILSHDFQEPIRKIMIFSDILRRSQDQVDVKQRHELLEKLNRSAGKLQNLVALLEEFVSLDIEPLSHKVDLDKLLEDAKNKVSRIRDFTDFDFSNAGLPFIEGFPQQLKILFANLIDNSIKYRNPLRKLAIVVSGVVVKENLFKSISDRFNYQDHLKLTFMDNGIGFENSYANYVFQMLKKLDQDSDGLGFGLPICKRVVERHFGSISVDSQPNHGTTFTILLPLKYFH